MAIDLGDIPTGTPPTAGEKLQIRSAIGVGQTDAPTFLAQTLTGQSLTGTQATSLVDLSATWNTTGTPSALKLNVIATAANAASRLLDLQIGGTSRMRVGIEGGVFSQNSLDTGGLFSAGSNGFKTIQFGGSLFTSNGMAAIRDPGTVAVRDSGGFCWVDASQNPATGPIELGLFKDAAGILAQRNGTAKQALRVYNTALSGAPEWAEFDWITSGGTNTLRLGTNLSGTGAARPIDFVTGGVVRMSIAAAGLVTIGGVPVGPGNNSRSNNVAVGDNALQANTTGNNNLAFGANAMQANTTGLTNAAFGNYAMQGIGTGSNNSGFGQNAIAGNGTGSNNSGFGRYAGLYIAGGASVNSTCSNSLFLGADTKALASNQTDQTVIGYNVTGSGSNSTTLNNTSATLTKINGTSAHVLDVTGTIKLSPPASVTPANNGELMVEATSNTTLTFKFKGSDGTVRSGTVILA